MEPEDLDAVLERWVPAPSAEVGTAHTEGPVDREALARLRRLQGEDEPNIVADLAGIFLNDARSRLVAVEEALQKGDAPAVERAAHTLKGGSGTMGSRRMSSLCAVGARRRIRRYLARLRTARTNQRRVGSTGRLRQRFQVTAFR
jgi:Hpt domain